jgi:ubiquinone/menaquinone biosynthesis C-methylase UbiE
MGITMWKFSTLIIIVIIAFLILVSIIWRLASRRYTIPCPAWLGWMVEMDNPFTKINRAAMIIEDSGIQQGMTVADIGCGPGRVTIPVAQKVGLSGQVVAVDIQEEMLNKVKEKAQKAHLNNIMFLQTGVGEGRLESNKFDRILLVSVLGEIPNQKAALQEIFNALKPGGILSITETVFDPHYQRFNAVQTLAEQVGFKQKKLVQDRFSYTMNLEKLV